MTSNRDNHRFTAGQHEIEDDDDTVIDAEVIEDDRYSGEFGEAHAYEDQGALQAPGQEVVPVASAEIAVIPDPPPIADRLLRDALNRRWLPFDQRVAGVAATVATLEALHGVSPVGEERSFDWPTCPSYAELAEHPIDRIVRQRYDGAVPTPLGT
jgi:hypothetical protein